MENLHPPPRGVFRATYTLSSCVRLTGARGGPGGGPPIFSKFNYIFLHCIQCLKKYF